jgi:hypothetical protein
MNNVQIIALVIGVGTVLGIGGILMYLHRNDKK